MFKLLGNVGLFAAIAIGISGCSDIEEQYIGKWSGADSKGREKMEITIMDNSKCTATIFRTKSIVLMKTIANSMQKKILLI